MTYNEIAKRVNYLRGKKRVILNKLIWLDILGGQCATPGCGYCSGDNDQDNLSAIQFHHLNPTQKTKTPAEILKRVDQSEMMETVVLCAVCHGVVHSGEVEKSLSENARKIYRRILEKVDSKCEDCDRIVGLGNGLSLHHPLGVVRTGAPSNLITKGKNLKLATRV